ncbi:unnamed protein product [Clonostachys rhizophaga]|uniref:Major facilitator superfamily (MFS) profile domain-containing protein n=1 Tax=Clonostachys rhizophaga TaxID=160324 RepID=A0A9N9YFF7_9HYPO|nr:unnamed protein product [Clonostachys rhizophaga]
MGFSSIFQKSSVAKYAQGIKETPRHIIFNGPLWFSSFLYALSAIPLTWEQGASAVIPSLPGFQKQFKVSSGADADAISNYLSIIYIGYAIGAALSFFAIDSIGRRWAYRAYILLFIIGQIICIFAPNMGTLYGARIITGMGIGSLSVIGPMSIAEISPKEIRGLLTSWYTVCQGIALTTANFCVLGIIKHIPNSKVQYQIPSAAVSGFMFLCILASFFITESPRWLLMVGRREEAVATMAKLRQLPRDHERIIGELADMEASIAAAHGDFGGKPSLWVVAKETFTVGSNLRRLQQVAMCYALAQLSGANSVTSYFIPIMKLLGHSSDTQYSIFLSSMYAFSKLWFSLIASFFFIDIVGRRRSLFIGIAFQTISHIYIAVFIKYQQQGQTNAASGQAAIAALFVHAFGYAVGLFILPYVFGGELWPDRIRSFGGAVGQTFHWLFIFAIKQSLPSLLHNTNNWGAFLFFAGWCVLGLIYIYLMVPEIAGLSVEEVDKIFEGSWLNAIKVTRAHRAQTRAFDTMDGVEDAGSETGKRSDNIISIKV